MDFAEQTHLVRDMIWPKIDQHCKDVVFDSPIDMERAYAHCRGFDVAVQAGGNCGVWPKAMSAKFAAVYTFEPDPLNFYCLVRNAPQANVFKFNAALGNARKTVELNREAANVGAHAVAGEGRIPVLSIDDLGLTQCDLIYLDIEGYELAAICGAFRTIKTCKPVIAFEDKGLSVAYGVELGEAARYLEDAHRYRRIDQVGNDTIMVPT